MNPYQAMSEVWRRKCYEPVMRNHDGWKYHGHRFEIKDGISLREVWMLYVNRPNPLMRLIRKVEE